MLFVPFIFMPAFPLGRVPRAAARGGLGIPHDQQQFQIFLLAPHQHETKQGRSTTRPSKVGAPRPWMASEPLFRGFSQLDLPRFRRGILDKWPKQIYWYLCSLNSEEMWFHIQGFANLTAAHFVAKCHNDYGLIAEIPLCLDSAVTVCPIHVDQGCCGRNKGGTIFRAPNHCVSAKALRGTPKSPKIVTTTFFNAIYLLPKDLRFEHWGARLASCPGRHLTSLRPGRDGQTFWSEGRIRDCLATGGPDTVRFAWQAAVNAVALLSTVGNVKFKKKFARYLVGRIKLVGGLDAARGL